VRRQEVAFSPELSFGFSEFHSKQDTKMDMRFKTTYISSYHNTAI